MGERIVTEKFRIVCRGTEGPEGPRYSVIGHQLPDGRFLTLNTAPGQGDDLWESREEYSPNGTDEIESITSLGVAIVDASAVDGAVLTEAQAARAERD